MPTGLRAIAVASSAVLPVVAAVVFGTAQPASAQFATAEKTYKYFVELCGDPFPNVEMARKAIATAGWKPMGQASAALAEWTMNDPDNRMTPYLIQTKRIENKGYCSLSFDFSVQVPLQKIVERYAFREDRALADRLGVVDPQRQYAVFSKMVDTGIVNLVFRQAKDEKSAHEIVITNLRVM